MASKKILFASLFATLLLGPKLSWAQRSDTAGKVGNCSSHGCMGQYSIPPSDCTGATYGCDAIVYKCCGQQVYLWVGDSCDDVLTKNPVARQSVELLSSEGIQIAVLGCDHHFALYRPPAHTPDQGNDRILTRRPLLPAGF